MISGARCTEKRSSYILNSMVTIRSNLPHSDARTGSGNINCTLGLPTGPTRLTQMLALGLAILIVHYTSPPRPWISNPPRPPDRPTSSLDHPPTGVRIAVSNHSWWFPIAGISPGVTPTPLKEITGAKRPGHRYKKSMFPKFWSFIFDILPQVPLPPPPPHSHGVPYPAHRACPLRKT